MAHRRSSIKKIRIDKRRRERNVRVVSELRTAGRKVQSLITAKKSDDVVNESRNYISQLDKAVKKGLMHKNEASRRKSRLQLRVNSLKSQK